jgi:hypothetical protein
MQATTPDIPAVLGRRTVFARSAVVYTLLLAIASSISGLLFHTLDPADPRSIWLSAASTLVVGIGAALVAERVRRRAAVQQRDARLVAVPTATTTLEPVAAPERTVLVPVPRADLLGRLPEVAGVLEQARVRRVDPAAGRIVLSAGRSRWRRETVILVLGTEAAGRTPVTVLGRPLLWELSSVNRAAGADVERAAAWLAGLDAGTP